MRTYNTNNNNNTTIAIIDDDDDDEDGYVCALYALAASCIVIALAIFAIVCVCVRSFVCLFIAFSYWKTIAHVIRRQ